MDKRKIIKIADRTFVITLPNKWLEKFELKKGDSVHLEEIYNRLVVTTKKIGDVYSTKIDFKNISTFEEVESLLASYYKQGFDEIIIINANKIVESFVIKTVKELLREFRIESKDNELILTNTCKENSKLLDLSIRRAFLTTITLADEILENLGGKVSNLTYLEEENDHATGHAQRLLNKYGYNEEKKKVFIYNILRDLEKICDYYRVIAEKNYKNISKEVKDYFKETNELLRNLNDFFYKKTELKNIVDLKNKRKNLQEKGVQLMKKNEMAFFLTEINEKIIELTGSLIALN